MITFLLCVLFVIGSAEITRENAPQIQQLQIIALLIIASVINDGFNKLEKAIKENKNK